ncbi:MAG: GNAT family N-acetyltransferase [Oscillospiraceae bacterium]|jgi:GNAT superfamily N-acetyltransferase
MQIRRATENDTEALFQNRVCFLAEDMRQSLPNTLRAELREYIRLHTADGRLISVIAEENGCIAACAMLNLYESYPTAANPGGRIGHLFNVNTRPEFRRKGLAEAVVRRLLQEATAAGAGIITLDYTEQGKPLYEKLGFEHAEHDMKLFL